ncbi:MAG: hypothetical protein AAF378_04235 [Cyanobacteria bacterium P01_A01_bin.84]
MQNQDLRKKTRSHTKPRYVLTDKGQQELEKALKLAFDGKSPSDRKISESLPWMLDRGTIGKIRSRSKGVNEKSLETLFLGVSEILKEKEVCLDFFLKNDSYKEADKQAKSSRRKQLQISPNNGEEFKGALRKLNYLKQKQLFLNTITEVKPAGTFLIYGEADYGQSWLLNQLWYDVPYHENAWQISIYIKAHRRNIDDIWYNLAQQLDTSPSPEAIVNKLYEHWQRRTVIIAIHDVSFIADSNLILFMQEFWQRLVRQVNDTPPLQRPERPYRLLLFLLGYTNSKSKLEKASLSLLQNADRNHPDIPLELPELEVFNQGIIEDWVGVHNQLLSRLWKNPEPVEQVMVDIVEASDTPMVALKQICECFEFSLEQDIMRELAL